MTPQTGIAPKNISKQVLILLCPVNISFLLPVLGGRLEGRLKHLGALITVGFEKYNCTKVDGNFSVVSQMTSNCHSMEFVQQRWKRRQTCGLQTWVRNIFQLMVVRLPLVLFRNPPRALALAYSEEEWKTMLMVTSLVFLNVVTPVIIFSVITYCEGPWALAQRMAC